MFTIDFTKPFLYKDIIYFNQGNLAANNILRSKLETGGDETLEGYIATVTFKTLSHAEINGTVNIVDAKNCIVDIKFPSNALEVGVNELEVILTKGDGIDKVVTPSPIIKYEVWQCITTGNGIQGDSNYPILIDLMSEVNNTVRIANNASATADASLKQTAKMLEVVNTNISKANEAIDNTNSAKDKALNAVEEVNLAKDNLISEVNTTKNTMIEDINSSKESILSDISTTKQSMITDIDKSKEAMITDTNKAIDKMNKDFEALTASQQQDMEVIKARDGEESLNVRLERDLAKGKTVFETVEGSYISVNNTLDSYLQNIEIKGNTVQNPNDLADIKSVGDKTEGQELYSIPIVCTGKNLFNTNLKIGDIDNSTGNERLGQTNNAIPVDYINCQGNMPIYLSFTPNVSPKWVVIYEYDKNKQFLGYVESKKITTKTNTKYLKFKIENGSNVTIKDLQLELGTQATLYEPYQEHKMTILSPTQLEKVGDVEDRIYFDKSENAWCINKKNIDKTLNGTEQYSLHSVGENVIKIITKVSDVLAESSMKYDKTVMCDKLPSMGRDNLFVGDEEGISNACLDSSNPNNNGLFIALSKSKASNLTEAIQYIKANNLKVKYNANESQKIVLPNDQKIKLRTFANQTNISFLTEVEGTIKSDVPKSLAASVNSNTREISDLWDFVLKTNLANFAVALNTLDTKLKLEQLTKAPR